MIRLVLAEDSPVQREMLSYVIRKSGEFDIVAVASDGEEAVRETERLGPDVVLMDCQMPKLDGIVATRAIMESRPTPIVIMTGSLIGDAVRLSFEAIGNGALAVVSKPPAFGTPAHEPSVAQLVRTLRLMSDVKVVRKWPERGIHQAAETASRAARRTRTRMIAVAGSTGAPGVLADVLAAARGKVHAPLLIVQHLSTGFLDGFALWLEQRSGVRVRVARDGMQTEDGEAYLAPDDRHLGVDRSGRIVLSDAPRANGFRPAATNLFRSVAQAFGPAAMGVLLSGMGGDGADGLRELRDTGGVTAVQNEETCVIFGMPKEAIAVDAAAYVLDPAAIAELMISSSRYGA